MLGGLKYQCLCAGSTLHHRLCDFCFHRFLLSQDFQKECMVIYLLKYITLWLSVEAAPLEIQVI